ncbi:MAG TPA: PAS domain-containing sensor histidine kinase, partial [Afipia sp.]
MKLFEIIRDHLDSLLHVSARRDVMTSARHGAFIAPRLLGSLAALACLPVYLAFRGAPTLTEVMVMVWLMTPVSISYYLSRTGHFERAHMLSLLALAAVIFAVAVTTGGISSFAAVWLIAVPLEAALSASRRVVAAGV